PPASALFPYTTLFRSDEGAVARPAPFASGVAPPGGQAEVIADPAQRLVHRAGVVGAEVEDVDRLAGALQHREHGVDAVVHVEVGDRKSTRLNSSHDQI